MLGDFIRLIIKTKKEETSNQLNVLIIGAGNSASTLIKNIKEDHQILIFVGSLIMILQS